MKRYNAYKDSGVKWIGEIPSHWKTTKLKHIIVKLYREKRPNSELLVCSNKGKVIKKGDSKIGLVADNDDIYQGVCKGDLLIHGMNTWHGAIAISNFDGMCTPVVHVCDSKQNKTYIALYLQFMAISKVFKLISNGVRQNTSDFRSWDKVGAIPIMVPPLHEQQAIVDYLKDKTLKIEQYVSARERERELLDSLKQSEIANVVTRGLNPNVKMKDSGIPWIGMIPEHWEVKKIRSCFSERREKVSDKDFDPLSVSKMGITPQLETAVKTDNGDNRKKVCKGDFVVNSRSDRKGSCGVSEYDGSVSLINIVLCPRNVVARYYHFLFRSNNYIEEFYRQGRGIVADLWTTRYSEMKSIYIPVPPLSEQQAIVEYIDSKLQKIDQYLTDLQTEIDYLKEFKQRLISDVVTGQIRVAEPQKGEQQ